VRSVVACIERNHVVRSAWTAGGGAVTQRRFPHEADRWLGRRLPSSDGHIDRAVWMARGCTELLEARVRNGRVFDPREHRDGWAEVPRGSATHGDAAL